VSPAINGKTQQGQDAVIDWGRGGSSDASNSNKTGDDLKGRKVFTHSVRMMFEHFGVAIRIYGLLLVGLSVALAGLGCLAPMQFSDGRFQSLGAFALLIFFPLPLSCFDNPILGRCRLAPVHFAG
jgi:hypothetical protein